MNPDIFAEWLRRQGHQIVRTSSSYWYDKGPRVYQAFPYHWNITPSEQELNDLLIRHRAIGLRYSTPLDALSGKVSYHMVFDNGPYRLEGLSAKTRRKVRRGLKHSRVERISMERLAQEGWRLQVDTLDRQCRRGSLNQTKWRRICLAAHDLSGFEAWGAIVQGELGASILITRLDGTGYMLYQQSHRKFFSLKLNNALSYTVTHELLSRPGVRTVFYGLHSLDAPFSVDEFKLHMGYRAKLVRQRVVFHPWLRPFANSLTHRVTAGMLRRDPGNHILDKMEGMLRFHLQGKRILKEQDWPECVVDRKSDLFEALKKA